MNAQKSSEPADFAFISGHEVCSPFIGVDEGLERTGGRWSSHAGGDRLLKHEHLQKFKGLDIGFE